MFGRSVWRPYSQDGYPRPGIFSAICCTGVGIDVGCLLGPVPPHFTIIRFDRDFSLSARECGDQQRTPDRLARPQIERLRVGAQDPPASLPEAKPIQQGDQNTVMTSAGGTTPYRRTGGYWKYSVSGTVRTSREYWTIGDSGA
ncbi:MAG: hypothetical protein J07HQW1_01274 [Haloquadratum walsbyi J07HQW1]|uniref:Uncharacterized protein n=1 Tax=Haloquadratum walsbyi J07HQW1 TaxID=1238424 RepID=U1N3W3_9EURY|nr:MAG: hypothetical protein J07HQW1_01274 [Haloquadratum walsbyi J07HQW1]